MTQNSTSRCFRFLCRTELLFPTSARRCAKGYGECRGVPALSSPAFAKIAIVWRLLDLCDTIQDCSLPTHHPLLSCEVGGFCYVVQNSFVSCPNRPGRAGRGGGFGYGDVSGKPDV